jgi:uncharacterized LabA/DUF88 family protein
LSIDGASHFRIGGRDGQTFAFIDADNMKCQFERALIRRGVTRDELAAFDLNRVFWLSNADRYYVFSAVEENQEPADWLRTLRATDSCIFRSGKLTVKKSGKKQQGVDVMLAVEALRCAYQGSMNTCVLFGGDGDMLPLIEMIVTTGKRMVVASFGDPEIGVVAPQMRDAADSYIHLGSIILKNCFHEEHRFTGMQTDSEQALLTHGETIDFNIDPHSTKAIKQKNGQISLVRDNSEDAGSIRTASFRSELGARAYLKLNGPLHW